MGKGARDPYRCSLRINLPIDKDNLSLVRVYVSVSEREFERHGVSTAEQVRLSSGLHAARQREVLLFAYREINLDRIDLRDRGKCGGGADQITHLSMRLPGDSRDHATGLRE